MARLPSACDGMPRNPDTGFKRACPLQRDCGRYSRLSDPQANKLPAAPYDFESETCNEFYEA